MRTLTANVYVTKSLPAIDKLFFAEHKLQTFQEGLKSLSKTEYEESFVASPMRNDGLAHFEYSFQANGNAAEGKGINVVMRLQETSKLLEMFLLENDPLARIIENRQEKVQRLNKSSRSKDLPGDPFKSVDLKDKLKRSSRYYFAFGTSDNIKDWSGPYSMQLAGATLVNDENNVRSIEVTFIPDTESFKSYSDNLGKLVGYNDSLKNLSQFITSDSVLNAHAKIVDSNCINKEYDLDYRLRKLIKQYIGSFTLNDGNAVVVLPHKFGRLKVKKEDYTGSMDAYARVGAPRPLQGPQPTQQEVREAIIESSNLGSGFIPIGGIFDSVENLKAAGVLVNKFSEFHTFVKSTSLSNNTINTRQAVVDYLNQIIGGIQDVRGAGAETQFFANNRRERLAKLADLDKLFEEQQERARDRQVAKAELEAEEKIGKAEIEKAEKIAALDDYMQTYGVEGTIDLILGSFTYYRFIEEVLFPLRPKEPRGPIPELTRSNAFDLYYTACDIELDRKKGLAQTALDREIKAANDRMAAILKPDSFARNKFRSSLTDQPTDIETQTTNVIEGIKRDVKTSLSERTKKLRQINTEANWDLLTSPEYVREMGEVKYQSLSLAIESRNLASQDVPDGFSPLIAPLVKLISYLKDKTPKDVKNSYYDFYEETDMRILKLWHANGIISDPSRPAYVFGDINEAAKILYLEPIQGNDNYSQHSLNTLFAFDSFNRNDGEAISDQPMAIEGRNFISSSEASEKYEKYVRQFKDEFPTINDPLEFKHNQQGANVTDLNYRLDNYIVTLLSMPVRSSLDKGAIGTTRLRLARDAVESAISSEVKNELAKFPEAITSDINNIAATLIDENNTSTDLILAIANDKALVQQKNAVDLFSFLYFMQNYDDLSSKVALSQDVHISKSSNSKPRFDQYYEAILDLTKKLLVRSTVRTLPIFNQKSYLKKKCTLNGTTGGIIGFPEKLRKPAPYNGNYTILGYKHVISPSKIYSEFELVREGLTSNAALASKSVKEFLCEVLKGKLLKFEKARERLVATYLKESPFAGEIFKQTSAALNFLEGDEGTLGMLYDAAGRPGINQLNIGPFSPGDTEKRIEKALKTMGCK
jgi:hypothetical protein|tara:strand:+ start:79 stop:3378 length:3300 start_codon:yes stop_codon:yes gene_type:complete